MPHRQGAPWDRSEFLDQLRSVGQRRYHHGQDYSRAVPWTEGTRVFFTDDALGAA